MLLPMTVNNKRKRHTLMWWHEDDRCVFNIFKANEEKKNIDQIKCQQKWIVERKDICVLMKIP